MPPCENCRRRFPGCHTTENCEEWAEYQKKQLARKKAEYKYMKQYRMMQRIEKNRRRNFGIGEFYRNPKIR